MSSSTGKPWKAGDHLFPLRMLATDTNLTIRAYMDGGFAESYWMGGRAAQVTLFLCHYCY
jgi:hypothetical protein